MSGTVTFKKVERIIAAIEQIDVHGVLYHRSFPSRTLLDGDPFLLFNEIGPMQVKVDGKHSGSDHPHCGFEIVTYLLAGELDHQDSYGYQGRLTAGDAQWMTAGKGVVHRQMHSPEFVKNGGLYHGFRLWVNLSKKHKTCLPSYQEIKASALPYLMVNDDKVKIIIIAGEIAEQKAKISTKSPIFYFHIILQPGTIWQHNIPSEFNVFAYVVRGRGTFGKSVQEVSQMAEQHQTVMFDNEGDAIEIVVGLENEPLEVLLIGGIPHKESIVRYGPFVMNTEDEIREAFIAYHTGQMGNIRL